MTRAEIIITEWTWVVSLYYRGVIGYLFCLFVVILYVPSTIFQLCRDGSSWVEPVLS